MGTVQVALKGPSPVALQVRLEEIARDVGADVSPYNKTTGFETDGSATVNEITAWLNAPLLNDDEFRAKLAPFENEEADPRVGVQFVVLS